MKDLYNSIIQLIWLSKNRNQIFSVILILCFLEPNKELIFWSDSLVLCPSKLRERRQRQREARHEGEAAWLKNAIGG